MSEPVGADAQFSDAAKHGAQKLRTKAERNIVRSKHDGRTEKHGPACEGCQILGLMAEVDRLRTVVEGQDRLRGISSPGLVLDTLIALPRISSSGLRKIADEAQRIIDRRMEDGVFD